jgi:hypothetical protein
MILFFNILSFWRVYILLLRLWKFLHLSFRNPRATGKPLNRKSLNFILGNFAKTRTATRVVFSHRTNVTAILDEDICSYLCASPRYIGHPSFHAEKKCDYAFDYPSSHGEEVILVRLRLHWKFDFVWFINVMFRFYSLLTLFSRYASNRTKFGVIYC